MSEQDFYWCKGTEPGQERSCSTNWSIKSGIITWVELTRAGKYPVSERCLPYNPTSRARCSYDCQDVDPRLKLGKFYWQRLQDPSEMQDQIRQFGSVLTRMEVWTDMKAYFASNPTGVYQGPGAPQETPIY
ncbi:hypothetical protein MNEG_10771 [Monoraphidium neglectum]|uniref:Uncharacterized protein n=1 Tax=Monoraphidium neglectum TaxID=145388 RepID=A0A0D2KNJ6_9CHLO|nr:hypothetical protein MNEG_10771 [Monoraphidium neglectum]KIY97193.1 hypothetical protein MNEG_10771 [Monoraphidium neglectum]|eukprot:XP_013896213.1 hypothetical protein MNEG_10771 [Monoraphidium neglectum]